MTGPEPLIDVYNEGHWAGLAEGKLRLPRCRDCGYVRPRFDLICPECLSEGWNWATLGGEGVVHAIAWYMQSLHPEFTDVPYNVAVVELDEGPRLISTVRAPMGAVAVGDRVRHVVEHTTGGDPLLCFVPCPGPPAA